MRQGKVRYIGASNHSAAQVVELLWAADRLGLEPIVCLQNQYNLLHRWPIEADLFIAVPDAGVPAAMGYASASGIPLREGLKRTVEDFRKRLNV